MYLLKPVDRWAAILAFATLVGLGGCAATKHQAFDGPARTASEVGTVHVEGWSAIGVGYTFKLTAVDGSAVDVGAGAFWAVDVLPGDHKFTLAFNRAGARYAGIVEVMTWTETVRITVAAGEVVALCGNAKTRYLKRVLNDPTGQLRKDLPRTLCEVVAAERAS